MTSFRASALLVPFFATLAGCVQTESAVPSTMTAVASKPVARADVSPRGASVAILGFDGGPADVSQRFGSAFAEAARTRDVTAVPAGTAAYFLRGYLTATPAADGVHLTYVCDLFDRGKRRAQRFADEVIVPPRGADPWAAADDTKIAALAERSAQDLADALTNMPEASAEGSARKTAPSGRTADAR